MDWFEKLTGFRETDYDDTRAKLKVEGSRLRSLVNGKRLWHRRARIGVLAIPARKGEIRRRTARAAKGKRGDWRRAADASIARKRRRIISSGVPVQLAGDGISHGDTGARRHPLPTRPYSRPRVRDRRWRSHDLPQLLRAGRWQQRPDDGTPTRRVGRPRRRLWGPP